MARINWTKDDVTVVLYEYCRRPFGQFNSTKPFVIELSKLINRTPAAIVRKVGNIASFDPQMQARGVGGLIHTARVDKETWDKYYGHWEKLTFDAETILAKLKNVDIEKSVEVDLSNLPEGSTRITEVKRRINQDFFRRTVLASYNQKCCITGINNVSLLHACHIVDWSTDMQNRTNPENGLCLNVIFHKAYDEHLIGISPDYDIELSDQFFGSKLEDVDKKTLDYFRSINKQKIILPTRFSPNKDLLAIHYEKFKKTI